MSARTVRLCRAQTLQDIEQVSQLAHTIWREYYPALLSTQQIEYMLASLQSPGAILQDMEAGMRYYIIMASNQPAGYTAIRLNHPSDKLFLSKLYLLKEFRGKGLALQILETYVQMGLRENQTSIWLTVNKENPSVDRYKKMGFLIVRSEQTDIGDGYIMDDYIMQKDLPIKK